MPELRQEWNAAAAGNHAQWDMVFGHDGKQLPVNGPDGLIGRLR
ncbi:MAG: hypothetical protein AB7O68_14835 [Pirellulales bacterium]